jgi:hypothetical protein
MDGASTRFAFNSTCHDGDEGFHQHCAIAYEGDLRFVLDHLRCRAGRNQRMPSGNSAAGDGDEQEREQAAGPNRSAAVDEFGHGRHLQIGTNDDDADGEQRDGANLEESRQVIARGQKQPDRQHGRDEAVSDDNQRECLASQIDAIDGGGGYTYFNSATGREISRDRQSM